MYIRATTTFLGIQLLCFAVVLAAGALLCTPALAEQDDAAGSNTGSTIIRSNVPGPAMHTQRFFLSYEARFDIQQAVRGEVIVWVPFPLEDDVQKVENYWMGGTLPPEKLLSFAVKRENEYGNRYVEARVLDPEPGDKLSFQYSVVRREYSNPPIGIATNSALILPPSRRFLQPDRLVPLDSPATQLAATALAGINPKTSEGRDAAIDALYNKTISMMSFDTSGEGWGRGDVAWALEHKRGNCADFQSVLIGMARAAGIPAKFEIGIPIPNDEAKGTIGGYHCWTYLFHPQRGWVPLDATEGAKDNRKLADFYLGRIGSDRVAFSVGRDLKLGQRGEPLNFFILPYAEVAGAAPAETARAQARTEATVQTVPMKLDLSFEKLAFP